MLDAFVSPGYNPLNHQFVLDAPIVSHSPVPKPSTFALGLLGLNIPKQLRARLAKNLKIKPNELIFKKTGKSGFS